MKSVYKIRMEIVDLVVVDGELKGDTVYTLFSVIINYLDANYRKFMKCIWQGN